MSDVTASAFSHRRRSRQVVVVLLALIAVVAGVFIYQRHYMNVHLPQIRTGMAMAGAKIDALITGFGSPPGATSLAAIEKSIGKGGKRSMWHDTPCNITWIGTWDAPNDHDSIRTWYEQQLVREGWKVFHQRIPSNLKHEYWKDKWLLTIEKRADFSTDHRLTSTSLFG